MTMEYKALNARILGELDSGTAVSTNRTKVDTISVFGADIIYDLAEMFPITTMKSTFFRGAKVEQYWMFSGDTNTAYLNEQGVTFWNQWHLDENHLGLVVAKYGNGRYRDMTEADAECYMAERPWALAVPKHKFTVAYSVKMNHLKEMIAKNGSGVTLEDLRLTYFKAEATDTLTSVQATAAALGLPTTLDRIVAYEGDLGPVYGELFRRLPTSDGPIDQLSELMVNLKKNPMSRRHVVDLWAPNLLPDESLSPQENVLNGKMALAPCHFMFTVKVEPRPIMDLVDDLADGVGIITVAADLHDADGTYDYDSIKDIAAYANIPIYKLNLHYHMRSSDTAAGKPINDVFYAIVAHILAAQAGMAIGKMWATATDAHIYLDQVKMVRKMMDRVPYDPTAVLVLPKNKESIFDYKPEEILLCNYHHQGSIKVPVAI